MKDDYIIFYREIDRGDWMLDTMGEEIPSSMDQAGTLLAYLREQMGDAYEFKVECLSIHGPREDVTSKVEGLLDAQQAEMARHAAEDAAHVRSETFGWECV